MIDYKLVLGDGTVVDFQYSEGFTPGGWNDDQIADFMDAIEICLGTDVMEQVEDWYVVQRPKEMSVRIMSKDEAEIVLRISSLARDMSNSIYSGLEVFDADLKELHRLRAELDPTCVRFDQIEPNASFQDMAHTGRFVRIRDNRVEEMCGLPQFGVGRNIEDWSPVFFKKSEKVIPLAPSPLTPENVKQIESWVLSQIGAIEQTYRQPNGARKLFPEEQDWASLVGVRNPDQIYVIEVDVMPSPPHGLELLAQQFLDPSRAAGLTLGYCVLIKKGCYSRQLMQHELRHVHQVEFHGLYHFLEDYLNQVVHCGYDKAPFELDAIEASHSGINTY